MACEKLIIIGGVPRSGTSLTARVIGSHPDVGLMPAEFKFLGRHARGWSVEDLLRRESLKRKVDLSDLYDREPGEAYQLTISRYADILGKRAGGEKTPYNEFYWDTLRTWLDGRDWRFIHLVRTPFDVMASHMNRSRTRARGGERELLVACRNWNRSLALGLARSRRESSRYLLLRYEELTGAPTEACNELCRFLEIAREPELMARDLGSWSNSSFTDVTSQARSTIGPIPRKSHLSEREIEIVSATCGELACAIGYDDPDLRPLPQEKRRHRFSLFRLRSEASRRR